jgi:putative hydroxymethylpyrimidine transport system substrate-binding protein
MKLPTLLLAALACAGLAACGEKDEPIAAPRVDRATLVLDYFPNADHAGIYAADFRAAGLDVDVQAPSDASAPLKLLSAGRADVAVTYHPELLLARAQGEDLVAVGALVQGPLNSIISLGRVRRPQDLRGKKVGVSGVPADEALLKAIAADAGIPYSSIEQVRVGFNLVPALLSKRVDAVLGAYWNIEATELERRGEHPTVLRLERIGVPRYDELVLVARRDTVAEHGPMLRKMLRALDQGHQRLRDDPAAGIQPLLRANPDLREPTVREQVEATLPVFFPEDRSKPWGWMDAESWQAFGQWMQDNDLLSSPIDGGDAQTTEFLPGEGAQPAEEAGPSGSS